MHERHPVTRRISFACFIGIMLLWCFSGCQILDSTLPKAVNGSVLVQHGRFIYRIGGTDAEGRFLSAVSMTEISIDAAGEIQTGNWNEMLPLPVGIAHCAAFSLGPYLYVVGGENEQGPADTVFMAKIDETDGSLGFSHLSGGVKFWIEHLITLPEPRSRMGWVIHDGRIFLIGGIGEHGELDSIIHSRVWVSHSGKCGNWYISPEKLPVPSSFTSAGIMQERLYIFSGLDSAGRIIRKVFSYAIGNYGLLSSGREEMPLPSEVFGVHVIKNGQDLVVGGGINKQGNPEGLFWDYDGSQWSMKTGGQPSGIMGYGVTGGKLLLAASILGNKEYRYPDSIHAMQREIQNHPGIAAIDLQLAPLVPQLIPGSGYIRSKGTSADTWAGMTDEILYTANSLEEPIADPFQEGNAWQTGSSLPLVTSRNSYLAVIGKSRTGVSETTVYEYHPLSHPTFFAGTLSVNQTRNEVYQELSLGDELIDGTILPITDALFKLSVSGAMVVKIDWLDSTDETEYTSAASFILLEEDYYTEVLDHAGRPVTDIYAIGNVVTGIGHGSSATVTLQPGIYYLKVIDTDAEEGGTVGVSIWEMYDE